LTYQGLAAFSAGSGYTPFDEAKEIAEEYEVEEVKEV
jgi:hypothetical protein